MQPSPRNRSNEGGFGPHSESLFVMCVLGIALAIAAPQGKALAANGHAPHPLVGILYVLGAMLVVAMLLGLAIAAVLRRWDADSPRPESFGNLWQAGTAWGFILTQAVLLLLLVVAGIWKLFN